MSYQILLNREKFFFNNYNKSSHIQFQLKDEQSNKLVCLENGYEILTSFSNGYNTKAFYNKSNECFDVVYRSEERKFRIYNCSISEINGVYIEDLSADKPTYKKSNYFIELRKIDDVYQWFLYKRENNIVTQYFKSNIINDQDIEQPSSEENTEEENTNNVFSHYYSYLIPPRSFISINNQSEYDEEVLPKLIWINTNTGQENLSENNIKTIMSLNIPLEEQENSSESSDYLSSEEWESSSDQSSSEENIKTTSYSIQILFQDQEFESIDVYSNQVIPDCSDDDINFKNKSLVLSDIPNNIYNKFTTQYHYAVKILQKQLFNEENENVIYAQKIYSSQSSVPSWNDINNNVSFGTKISLKQNLIGNEGNNKLFNHLYQNYIVELSFDRSGQNTKYIYRLYEAIKYNKKRLTVALLNKLKVADKNYSIGEQYNFNDEEYTIVQEEISDKNGNGIDCWAIQKYDETLKGYIFDTTIVNNNYDSEFLEKIVVGIPGTINESVYYNIFLGENNLSSLIYDCQNCYPYAFKNENNDVYYKGRLLQVIEANSLEAVTFEYLKQKLFSFKCDALFNDVNTIEFVIQDKNYSIPSNLNADAFDFCEYYNTVQKMYIENSISSEQILNYFNINEQYLYNDYMISAVAYNEYGDPSLPYLQEQLIVYYKNNLKFIFEDNALTYVNKSTKNASFDFKVYYPYMIDEETEQNIEITKEILFNKIYISTINFNKPFENQEDTFDKYPYVFENVNSSRARINYNGENNYTLTLPYGLPPDTGRETISLPFSMTYQNNDNDAISLGGDYELMSLKEVNEQFYGPSEQMTESTYIGQNKIYKKKLSDNENENANQNIYYIRTFVNPRDDNEYLWCIVGYADEQSDSSSSEKIIKYGNNVTYNIYVHSYSYEYNKSQIDGSIMLNENMNVAEVFSNRYFRRYNDSKLSNQSNNDFLLYYYDYGYPRTDFYKSYSVSGHPNITLIAAESEHGYYKDLYIMLEDEFGNMTSISNGRINIYQIKPKNLSLKLFGSTGNQNYTGFYQKYDRFFPSEFISVNFSAESGINLYYKLTGNYLMQPDTEWIKMNENKADNYLVKIKPVNYNSLMLDQPDSTIEIKLEVKDQAGNTESVSRSIRYISRLFRTQHQNLMEETTSYNHSLFPVEGNSIGNQIIKIRTSNNEYARSWNEIWYPSTHGVPLNDDGSINVTEALRISKDIDSTGKNGPTSLELLNYDQLSLKDGQLATDSEGRYMQNMEKWDNTKTYSGMENSRISNNSYDRYWIIDNTGNIDFQLEFQVFDFSGKITNLPANLVAPDNGDMLAIYDASNDESVYKYIDPYGNTKYKLIDSSKLNLICILKGSYKDNANNPFTMIKSTLNGTLTQSDSGFVMPPITNCQRICLIPFTDYGDEDDSVASGFKLKAGPKHYVEYSNYDSINNTGEFWIHQSPEVASGLWNSCNELKLEYKYYATFAQTNFEKGCVKFNERLDYPLLGTFTHYLYLYENEMHYPYKYFSYYDENNDGANYNHAIRNFITSQDDMVDYSEPSFYVQVKGTKIDNTNIYEFNLPNRSGKLDSGYTLVKDTGILTIPNNTNKIPLGRILSNYYYHTYYRLTSDGYGDLYFYGTGIIVPAPETNSYKDWAYVDLKIVNEGLNALNSGVLQFLTRGYITNGTVVDTVLDQNRPWDIQQGTTEQTVSRTGAVYATSIGELDEANRVNAFNARQKQTCNFGTLNPKSQVYVRVFWCISDNQEGTNWIDCTKGSKCFSAELSGLYYIFTV